MSAFPVRLPPNKVPLSPEICRRSSVKRSLAAIRSNEDARAAGDDLGGLHGLHAPLQGAGGSYHERSRGGSGPGGGDDGVVVAAESRSITVR